MPYNEIFDGEVLRTSNLFEITPRMIEAAARSWWNSITHNGRGSWSSQSDTTKQLYRTYAERSLVQARGEMVLEDSSK